MLIVKKKLDKKKLAKAIRDHREDAGLTQTQLGKITGLSASTIGMYEQGRRIPPIDALVDISVALGKDITDFIFYINENEEELGLNATTLAAHLDAEELSEEDLEDIKAILNILKKKR